MKIERIMDKVNFWNNSYQICILLQYLRLLLFSVYLRDYSAVADYSVTWNSAVAKIYFDYGLFFRITQLNMNKKLVMSC